MYDMEKDSKIYIAGNTGLVGSAIVRKLKVEAYNNLVYTPFPEYDLRDQQQVEDFFQQEKPEYVFLAAAKVGGILANSTYPAEFIYDNLAIPLNVIHASYKYGVKKLINFGSSCIYPKLAPQPLKEEYILSGKLEPTNEPYAIAKIAAIKLCKYYNKQYGTNFLSVMPTNLYGPSDNFNLETCHLLPALIRKFHLAKLIEEENYEHLKKDVQQYPIGFGLDEEISYKNEKSIIKVLDKVGINKEYVILWGTGSPRREFLYTDDLADACIYLMKNFGYTDVGEVINIGTGVDLTVKDLARMIKEIIGFSGRIKYDSTRPDGTPRKLLNVERLKKLGWKQSIGLKEGIEKTYNWYISRIEQNF